MARQGLDALGDALKYGTKDGDLWDGPRVMRAVREEVQNKGKFYLNERGYKMQQDVKKTTVMVEDHVINLDKAVKLMIAAEGALQEKTKTVSAGVRSSAEKLMQGVARIQKQADYATLERYVLLLERSATAMETLAAIQESGKLDKIAKALGG